MKVMFATYPMAFHTPGGGEIQLLAYQKHLPAQGIEVIPFDQWSPRFLEYNLVHFFSCVGGSSHFCGFVKQLDLPLIVSSSLWITEETKDLYPIGEIRTQLDLADCVVANSDMECDMLSQVLDLPRDKFSTVYNGVDDIFFDKPSPDLFRREFGIGQPFILNVGNIEPRKNQLRLAQAMKSFPDYKLVLIGHVRDQAYFENLMETAEEQLIHIGSLPHESELLRSAYQSCEAFVLPSTLETPGLAALEAAAQGAALVVTKEGSTQEYFADDAIYVNPESIDSISQGVSAALSGQLSAIDVKRLEERVRRSFSWSSASRRLSLVYREVTTKKEFINET
ncbi:glycosyltransferase [Amphritea sp. HPY]|uniref:glycosyltransferase n=1 Tax=Amphritea sp. HPY TaxID=3421652 RepID=UPI003D7E9090